MALDTAIVIDKVNHYFGKGALRKQILFDINAEIRSGEIVIVTGPSGSGKTTLLTLIGALRSTQEGSLSVLGHELRAATEESLVQVRKQIGYIFQAHNLLDSLTAQQNVHMALRLHDEFSGNLEKKSAAMLEAVGLGDRMTHHPDQLSGGQKQRVAIARALASEPKIILADEPTASLDKKSGRDVVELMRGLARQQGCTVLLVTHDNRILDIADRIISLEDGRLASFTTAVMSNTQHMMEMLALNNRKGEVTRQVRDLSVPQFLGLLDQVTGEAQQFLRVVELSEGDAFESMLEQVLEAFTLKVGDVLGAERASLFLVDEARGEVWSKVAKGEGERPLEIRAPIGTGIVGAVAASGQVINIPDAYQDPRFNPQVDLETGYRTRSIVGMPILSNRNRVFAIVQLLNKAGGLPFDAADEERLRQFAISIGVILESWWRLSSRRAAAAATESLPRDGT